MGGWVGGRAGGWAGGWAGGQVGERAGGQACGWVGWRDGLLDEFMRGRMGGVARRLFEAEQRSSRRVWGYEGPLISVPGIPTDWVAVSYRGHDSMPGQLRISHMQRDFTGDNST